MVRVIFVLGDSRVLAVSSCFKFVSSAILSVVGYKMFGDSMAGFIGGLVIGNVIGYLVLLYSIRNEKINCLAQDIKYSLLFFVLAMIVDIVGGLPIAIVVCLGMAAWTLLKGRQLLLDRKSLA